MVFSNNVLIQWGKISISQQLINWVQPILTSNGTLGQGEFAVKANQEYLSTTKLYCAFDKNSSTSAQTTSIPATWTMYFGIPVNISNINFTIYGNGGPKEGYFEASNDGTTWIMVGSLSNSVNEGSVNLPINTSGYYNYWRMVVTTCLYAFLYCTEIHITATYKSDVTNIITFPTSYTSTNYSYSIGYLNEENTSYATSKSISGISLFNPQSSSGFANWMTIGY